jgi:antitoxin ParD1/3/4
VRELIRERQLREQTSSQAIEAIRAKLIETENSGFTDQTPAEILKEIKDGLGRDAL